MRAYNRQPKQPVTWLPQVFEIFKNRGHITSRDLAAVTGRNGGDALTRCRQLGIPIAHVGMVNGSELPRKLYAVDVAVLWRALEEAVKEIDQCARFHGNPTKAKNRTFRTVGNWIQCVCTQEKARAERRDAVGTLGRTRNKRIPGVSGSARRDQVIS